MSGYYSVYFHDTVTNKTYRTDGPFHTLAAADAACDRATSHNTGPDGKPRQQGDYFAAHEDRMRGLHE